MLKATTTQLASIVVMPRPRQETILTKLSEVPPKWQLGGAGKRDTVFTWMDAEQWTKWLGDIYGVKVESKLGVVITR